MTRPISYENANTFDERINQSLQCSNNDCDYFNSSEQAFRWILNTSDQYADSRYGGISVNDTLAAIWYNNKGYHSMPVYLNKLNTALLNAELKSEGYNITTFNHPIKLGRAELSISSMYGIALPFGLFDY